MKKTFWQKLKKPFFCLAPMYDVTDAAFRFIVAKYGKPDIMFTEFVSCDGLCSVGKSKLLPILKYDKTERPIVAQVFGNNPDTYYKAAKMIKEMGFDGLDINMGCPEKNIVKQGSGAGLIKKPSLAKELILAAKQGAGDIPVSVKTRIGMSVNQLNEWLPILLSAEPAAITIHARTRSEMSKVPARWETIKQAVDIAKGSNTLIIGNGDVKDLQDAKQKIKQTGADGAMLGRAVFGNPWLFNDKINLIDITVSERLKVMIEHAEKFDTIFGKKKNFYIMRKHFKAYVNGFEGAKALRTELMQTENLAETKAILKSWLKLNKDLLKQNIII